MLKSFLSNRKQCVKSGISYSDWTTNNHGVPRGTFLGHLIFVPHTNDFSEKMTSEDILEFGDDTCIIFYSKTNQDLPTKTCNIFPKNRINI